MIATPANVRMIGHQLDHPECVCVGPDGSIYAGGEAGQLYRISPDGSQRQIASTGGFVLGVALDGNGSVHCCDMENHAVMVVDPDGQVRTRSRGTPEHPLVLPNFGVFDRDGNYFVSDSGEYWGKPDGCVLRITPDGKTSMFHAGPFSFTNGLAIDPSNRWLYVVQSTAANICRVPLNKENGAIEITHRLPPATVPDGLVFAANGSMIITCYRPDMLFIGKPDGSIDVLLQDQTGELLNQPTNAAIHNNQLYIANLGGRHISVVDIDLLASLK